ncbi:probable calcium-binding protein CML34 [Octopus sinensis]|uniref:Probable calcium-binding protein CML34 n=1 Tax=Octopus sinensis TaxID=2607531 RepID=A0A6P7U0Z4_9MOLL|nr:probable calcium-binding protein CML34 [Octopus sinensis]
MIENADINSDSLIDHKELVEWLNKLSLNETLEFVDLDFEEINPAQEGISAAEYFQFRGQEFEEDYLQEEFSLADVDGDGYLSREEYLILLNPQETRGLKEFYIKDGFIDVRELRHKSRQAVENEYMDEL